MDESKIKDKSPNTKGKKIALLQSNYIPWKGYFNIINYVDEFIIYDEAQYTRRDWRNRNLIKTRQGLKWLTIPVRVKGRYKQTIRDTKVTSKKWAEQHWKSIRYNYSIAKHFNDYRDVFEQAYKEASEMEYLSDINLLFISTINSFLGIKTKISQSSEYKLEGDRNQKIISVCRQTGADTYITGPAAKDYIKEAIFHKSRIKLEYFNYSNYDEYEQLFGSFRHNVTIVDLIFNTGDKAYSHLRGT